MPDWLIYLTVFLVVFIGMEGVAWALHRYVMHGFLWVLHESHHRPRKSWFEMNDLFGFFFTAVSIGLFLAGTQNGYRSFHFWHYGLHGGK
jgi:beta-carotene 3-hydroxylase